MSILDGRKREYGLLLAIEKAGSIRALARKLDMSFQGVAQWRRIPVKRLLQVEAVTEIPRETLRPDLYI